MTRIKFVKRNLVRAEDIAIVKSIRYDSSVLDLGCGDGELLSLLIREKRVRGEGVELDKGHIHKCISRGISPELRKILRHSTN